MDDKKGVLGMAISGIPAFILLFFLMILFIIVTYFISSIKQPSHYTPISTYNNAEVPKVLFSMVDYTISPLKDGEKPTKKSAFVYEAFMDYKRGKILIGDFSISLNNLLNEEKDCLIIAQGAANPKLFYELTGYEPSIDYISLRLKEGEVVENRGNLMFRQYYDRGMLSFISFKVGEIDEFRFAVYHGRCIDEK